MKLTAKPLAVILVFIAFGSSTGLSGEKPIVSVQFESTVIGEYATDAFRKEWPTVDWVSLYDRAHIVQDQDARRGKVLQISYPKGAVGPKDGGGQFVAVLPPSEELWLSYYVKFEMGFDFRLGGKLPGLTSGGSKYTGGNKPANGEGWSARFMWREGGRAVVYLYHVEMTGQWGDDLALMNSVFTPGTWHKFTQHIKVNSEDGSNGVLEVWFDNEKVLSRSDIRFRIGKQGLIDSMYFSTFHGGNTKDWAPQNDSFAYFDNFVVSREPLVDSTANGK